MIYGSVCSGIEAATAAWHPLGWKPAFFSEIEPFPCSVLQQHYPDVPLHGDFTTIGANDYGPIDLLVGGTPCQSFSVAGLRKGMDDDRGNLALEFLKLADRKRPAWLVWENVPGVLSSSGGRDFGAFLGGLLELGYGFAYRVLNAQYFGVPQRRRRVFLVGYFGDWRPPAAVLFERHSLQGHSAPSREAGEETAGSVGVGIDEECNATIDGYGPLLRGGQGGTRQAVAQPYPVANTLTARMHKGINTTVDEGQTPVIHYIEHSPCLTQTDQHGVSVGMQVRRLTPVECERLQGFPDNFTKIPYRGKIADKCPDGPRYKALGNSMAVPVMAWIGRRIQQTTKMMNNG